MEEMVEPNMATHKAGAAFGGVVAKLAWQFRLRLALTLLLTVGRMACLAGVVHFLYQAIAGLLDSDAGPTGFAWAAGALLACQVGAALFHFLADECHRWFMEGVEVAAFQWAMRRLVWLPADHFRTNSLPQFLLHLEKLQALVRGFLLCSFTILAKGSAIVGILAGILPQSLGFGGVAMGLLALVAVLVLRRTVQLRRVAEQELSTDARFMDHTLGVFANVRDLRNYGLREQALRQFHESCKVLAVFTLQVAKLQARIGVWLNGVGIALLAGLVAAVLGLGELLGTLGIEPAAALTCFAALGMILEPLSDVVRSHTQIQARLARLDEVLELIAQSSEAGQREAGRPCGPIERVAFENVGYQRGGTAILEEITFEAKAGEIIGVIGRSGAGKTTLANLILRLQEPTSGRIRIDDQDAVELDHADFWRRADCVSQVACQVGGTLAEEVALARAGATPAEIEDALAEAGIDPGLSETPLDAEGWLRTEGKAAWHTRGLQQRVQWARLWLRQAELLVLDEPTSLADPAEERRFVQSLLARRHGRIIFVISHRPQTLAACDRLLVLDQGRLVEQGPRAELLPRWLGNIGPEWGQAS